MTSISVVMTTYNGEKYIIEQLDSIRQQTLQPDEVIIFDDCSSDSTVNIVRSYIDENGLKSWNLYCNEHNMGWRKNFVQALQTAKKDIVFLADQDDIWNADKIEEMSRILESNDEILLLASNCEILYSSETGYKYPPFYSIKKKAFYLDKIWANKGIAAILNKILKDVKKDTGELVKIPFDTGLFSGQRQGCVMVFRQSILNDALNYWSEGCPHDTLLWVYAAVHDGLYLLEKNTIKYRHHIANAGFNDTLGSGLTAESERKKISAKITEIDSLKPLISKAEDPKKEEVIKHITDYLKIRDRFLSNRKIKDGVNIIKKKGKVGSRQVLFDWLLAYMT